jgi:hypothetical protein
MNAALTRGPGRPNRRIKLRAKYRDPIDLDGLAGVILMIAKEQIAERRTQRAYLAGTLSQVAEQKYQRWLKEDE